MSGKGPGSRGALAEFLTARRAMVRPSEAGLPDTRSLRRVPGLRREEVARLAGISADYYTRLEQGRLRTASQGVLRSIAGALQLNTDQQQHLRRLANQDEAAWPTAPPSHVVRPGTTRLLGNLVDTPALVVNRHLDILAWNRLGSALLGDLSSLAPGERNYVRMLFLDPHTRSLTARSWRERAQEAVSYLRMTIGTDGDQARLHSLVGELTVRDDSFRKWWNQHLVRFPESGETSLTHPVVGELVLDWQVLTYAKDTEQMVVVLTPVPGSVSHDAVRRLDAWAEQKGVRAGASHDAFGIGDVRCTR